MSKQNELYNLRLKISTNSTKIKYLLENVLYKADSRREKFILVSVALDYIKEINSCSEKIGIILNH